jgi:retinol dehydrogenase 12
VFVIRKLATIIDPETSDKTPATNPVVINCLDPCYCKTGLDSNLNKGLRAAMKAFAFLFARTAEEGSRLLVIAASAGRGSHGGYMRVGALKEYAPMITSAEGVENGEYVWKQLSRKLEAIQPDILAGLAI